MLRNLTLAEIPKDKDVVMHCSGGMRAEMAHNLLKNSGINSRLLPPPSPWQKTAAL
ncbi:MAG: hypothetical protein KKF85_15180 [Gammaproteobacteria bacterium]|nr:hypothetical protein [Gammaproteobacteria bacterium]MBU3990649.1 hypothetical protein [Gammaproteobacteria bacterium]MBU4005322.1 hypothetical protein [Gammaproteobacteria bacterium]MBU4022500.1 hypothetical protein [Gammaproteobacteria bacterium]MBU4097808.1 hypothetical protein [Gammaproteobacteria bacterium]